MNVIGPFRGEYEFLSNFYDSIIYIDGERYTTAEHAYQALKTLDPWEKKMIRDAATPMLAKALGKGVKMIPEWEDVKVERMTQVLEAKFTNPFLMGLLLDTGDDQLVEFNTWGDTFWGVHKGIGENMLGKCLMQVRDKLRGEK